MQWYPTALWKLLFPVVLIGTAYLSHPYIGTLGSDARVLVDNLPYLLSLVAIVMAFQFNRSRLLFAGFSVAVFYWVVRTHLQVSLSEPAAWYAYLALRLALPVLTFFLLLLPERGIFNLNGLVFTLAFEIKYAALG